MSFILGNLVRHTHDENPVYISMDTLRGQSDQKDVSTLIVSKDQFERAVGICEQAVKSKDWSIIENIEDASVSHIVSAIGEFGGKYCRTYVNGGYLTCYLTNAYSGVTSTPIVMITTKTEYITEFLRSLIVFED